MTQRTCLPRLVVVTVVAIGSASPARADIFQWEYINPADPSQGKQQSTTLAPDGAGVDAVPGAGLGYHDLTMAYLIGADLTGAYGYYSNLTNADLSQANLTNAYFDLATLTGGDLTGAEVRGASFQTYYDGPGPGSAIGTGITLGQLYSTASYQARDLTGIGLIWNNLAGGNFAGQNLTNANFGLATLSGADLTGAEVRGASFRRYVNALGDIGTGITLGQLYSTASYQAHDLNGINLEINNLAGGNFAGQNLTNADLSYATLSGANFRQAHLTTASLYSAALSNADLTDAEVRGANLGRTGITASQLHSTASYQTRDLTGTRLDSSNLAGGNFAGQNFTNASLYGATLTGADFTSAQVRRADLSNTTDKGFTAAQLYSTASYQAHDLSGIGLDGNYLADWNFAGQNLSNAQFVQATLTSADFREANLTDAYFGGTTLTDADFTGAEVRGANFSTIYAPGCSGFCPVEGTGITLSQLYSTASYHAHDLTGIGLDLNNLAGGNFAGQNLTNAYFLGATLTDADLTGAEVRGVNFNLDVHAEYGDVYVRGTGLTLGQLYSTASYQAHDLTGVALSGSDLAGGNFAGQNLSGASFGDLCGRGCSISTDLSGATFNHANLTGAFFYSAVVTGADFTSADARGAQYLDLSGTTTTNLIRLDGHISGLDLDAADLLVIRDYDRDPARPWLPLIPITVDQHLAMGPDGALRMVFEADAWDSTISFAPGIPVTLGGTLELAFAADVNLASQVGRTFDLFDWTGVNPTGVFAIASPYAWDLSNLYTTGEVTLTAIPEPSSLFLIALVAAGAFGPAFYRRRKIARRNVCMTAFFASLFFVAVAHAAAVRTVALNGQAAPGTPAGVTYGSFGAHFLFEFPDEPYRGPVINDAGRVAFRADLTGSGIDSANNQGVWSEGSGSLALVARTGSAATGAPDGVNFARRYDLELFEPVINSAGQTAFYGGLTDGTVGLWSEGSGSLALVARDGSQAPGTPAGVYHSFELFRDFYPDQPKLNDAGQTAFWANLTGAGVNNTNDWGVWSEASGSLGLVARSGSPAPGTPAGVNFDSFFFQTGFNDAGQTAFYAFVTGSGVDPSNDVGIWSERSGSLALVARSGSPAPGISSGVNFDAFAKAVTINNAGRTAFLALLTGDGVDETNEESVWSEGSGTLALVARRGSPAPGTQSGVNFASFNNSFGGEVVLNDAGQTAFRAELSGTGVNFTNNRGIWLGGADDLTLAARTGNPAPGTASGVRFSDLLRPALNSEGQIAFRANLTGTGVGSGNNLGIWATDQFGALQLIARKGALLEVAPGDLRTISDLGFVADSGNSDGRASAFNDLGQLVFWARFTNGTQGVFVSSSVAHLPGDFDNDGTVDGADYVVWRKTNGTPAGYDTWRGNFGRTLFLGSGAALSAEQPLAAVPEPACIALAAVGLGVLVGRRRRSQFARRPSIGLALVVSAAIELAPAIITQGATIEFDASAKSPAVIPFDPDASFEGRSAYVSGRIGTDVKGPITGGTNINTLVGADAFYTHGYTGTNAVMANIEEGHIWNGHETLTHVQQIPNHPSALNEFDRHATWVGSVLGGRRGGANPGPYQQGMAPDAQLYSGAIATQWNGPRHTLAFSTSDAIRFDQYRKAFSTGVNAAGRTADVINSSWGSSAGANGSDTIAIGTDGFVNANPRTLFVAVAGNSGPGPDKVLSPGSAYNNLCVAALGRNPPYDSPARFSSGGPNDYVDPVNGTKNDARQVVDIAAPGQNLSAAYYGGETGGNGTTDNPAVSGPGPTGLPYGSLGGPDFYTRGGLNGTSLAAPTVAGGAALLYDAAYSVFAANADARDARVMKAVLMNSADKTIGWNNGQVTHPNGNGGVLTTQGLDNRVGTGRLNLAAAYDQFLSGTTDVAGMLGGNLGLVNDIGWDFGQVVSGTTNDYYFDTSLTGGSMLTATLTWFRDRRINASNTVFDDSFDDLNLELWSVVGGVPTSLISESSSLYNESEHFSFALPTTGDYALRVRWFNEVFDMVGDTNQELYGLAWSAVDTALAVTVPEPGVLLLFSLGLVALLPMRRGVRGSPSRALPIAAALFPLIAFAASARADIYQWEYINPADPSQGKRQSTTLAPDGAGVDAVPGADLTVRNLSMAYLHGADLTGANGGWANLTNADLSQANLTNAYFSYVTLTDADFTDAEIRGANFYEDPYSGGTGITLGQLYSTASYQAHELTGIGLGGNNLSGWNFAGQNLTNANFYAATLTGGDFTGAEVRGTYFDFTTSRGFTAAQLYSTASYQAHDLTGIDLGYTDLSGWNFAGQNLTNANFHAATLTNADLSQADLTKAQFIYATLTGADFTGADVRGAIFDRDWYGGGTGITPVQLYSTASYQAHDLTGIVLQQNILTGVNLAGQNLTNAVFYGSTLTGADLSQANLTNANFFNTSLTAVDFTGAVVRGARFDKYFGGTGITLAQLYSTASYQARDLNGVMLSYLDLTGGNFAGQNLTDASFIGATLTGADFRNANLTNSVLGAPLTGADFTDAEVRGASLYGMTLQQLYSTASYQARDLSGIRMGSDLTGGNFAGQKLANTDFGLANLTGADFTNAEVSGANFGKDYDYNTNMYVGGITLAQLYSTASYQAHDLTGVGLAYTDLSGWNFAGQNLVNASFHGATLSGTDFTGADVRGANFSLGDVCGYYCYPTGTGTGIALAQLYSTTSFQASDLRGLRLDGNDLTGGNFAGQNLTNAGFIFATLIAADLRQANLTNADFAGADLTGANFRQANLANAIFASGRGDGRVYATLADADLTAADARGASGFDYADLSSATTTNLIRPNGHINGLDLDAGGLLVVRDYDGRPEFGTAYPPIPITVDQQLSMGPGGTLRVVFEADAWDSTISFAPGIPVTLGGTLELAFAADVNLASQVGRTFDLFDWTGVNPTGVFAIASPYAWDLSNLYTTGEVTLTAVPEPATVGLLFVGMLTLATRRRGRTAASVSNVGATSLNRQAGFSGLRFSSALTREMRALHFRS